MVRFVSLVYNGVILTVPLGGAGLPIILIDTVPCQVVALFAFPVLYAVLYLLTCGLLSWPHRRAIKAGEFVRDFKDATYGPRRLYATCWTAVYYSPLYSFYLSTPGMRELLFRLFGYKGCNTFTVYPDTWIRDLPLLEIGRGAYIANRATIGTNLPLKNGRILVGPVRIGEYAMIGHSCKVCAGTVIGDGAELGHASACGVGVNVGRNSIIGPMCGIDHRVAIGENTQIGAYSYIGRGTVIGSNIRIPLGSRIPRMSRIMTQEDASKLASSEAAVLAHVKEEPVGMLPRDMVERHELSEVRSMTGSAYRR